MNISYKNPKIILIAGKARSGKSTVCNILKEKYESDNKKVIVSPYTKYLKSYIKEITNKEFDDSNKPREFLQKLGVEIIQNKLGKKYMLINRQLDDIDVYSYFFEVIIIPDVRFVNEIDNVKEKYDNVVTIQVVSKRENNMSFAEKNHITELALNNYNESNFDYIINNDNYEQLVNIVDLIYKEISIK